MDIMQNYTITYINREDYDRDTGVYGEARGNKMKYACVSLLDGDEE